MDQPTAEEALKRLDPLVGEWTLEAKPPDGPPWPGEARTTIEWHDSGAHLVQRSTVEMLDDSAAATRVARDNVRDLRIRNWPEATHSLPMEFPERLNRELLGFVAAYAPTDP
jgi:hypothetical protein